MKLSANHPAHLVLGLTIWSVWFIAVYGGLSVFCSGTENHLTAGISNPINAGLLLLTVATGLALAALTRWCWREAAGFPGKVSAGLYAASTIATFAVGGPILFLPPCL